MTTGSVGLLGRRLAREDAPRTAGTEPLRAITPVLWLIAGAFVALELAFSWRYGFHRDELYFIVAGRRPALGYVDQPPIAPLFTRAATTLFGTSPTAIRISPALAGGGVVVLAGLTARSLGGRKLAQALAAVATGCSSVLLAAAHLANTTVYDLLAWSAIVLLVIEAVNRKRPRLWVAVGAVAGLGLENKDLPLLLIAALGLGLLATGRWRVLPNRWVALGAGVALALWLPNLIWQAEHSWPELAMSSALHKEHTATGDYASVLPSQLLYVGVFAVPMAYLGLKRLIGTPELRFIAIVAGLVLVFVVIDIPGRPYYTDGLMPVVFAAGAVAVERRPHKRTAAWLAAPIVWAVGGLPLVLPVLPVSTVGQLSFLHKINYDLGEQIGWPQLTATVGRLYRSLPPAQQKQTSIFTSNYGEAGAMYVYGAPYHLPPAISGHNSFSMWGPEGQPDQTVISIGAVSQLEPYFSSCRTASTFRSPHDVNNDENGTVISVCTGPQGPWRAFWRHLRHYD